METFSLKIIKEILPHRYPFLLIDKVIEVKQGENPKNNEGNTVTAVKNVTVNEEFFNGHFPERPIMPGVLIIEAMAQAGAIADYRPDGPLKNFMIASIEDAKFRRPVVPGDQLVITAHIIKDRGRMKKIECKSHVDGDLVAEAVVLAVAEAR